MMMVMATMMLIVMMMLAGRVAALGSLLGSGHGHVRPATADRHRSARTPLQLELQTAATRRKLRARPVLAGQAQWEDLLVQRSEVFREILRHRSDKCFLWRGSGVLPVNQPRGTEKPELVTFSQPNRTFWHRRPSVNLFTNDPADWMTGKKALRCFQRDGPMSVSHPLKVEKKLWQLGIRSPSAGCCTPRKTSSIIRPVFTFVSPQSPSPC